MNAGDRTAVTGMGVVASVGDGVDEVFAALCRGRSGRAPLRAFASDRFRAEFAYEIDDRPDGRDLPGRATKHLLHAVAQAVTDAGLGEDLTDIPVLVGTGLRELRSVELVWTEGAEFDIRRLDFGVALRERFGTRQAHTFANACSASLHTLALGMDMLTAGVADTVVVAGVDTITASMYGALDRVQLTTPDRVLPFDEAHCGTLMGDGAAAVVLSRRAPGGEVSPHAFLRGVSMNCDAHHPTAPDPESIARAMRSAHLLAEVTPADIDLVLLHGTGTVLNDEAEAAALGEVFGPWARRPIMTALKSMTGHTSGNSGLLSLIVAARSLATGAVPPTLGLRNPIAPARQWRFARTERDTVAAPSRLAQIDAFGFGGVNAVAILESAS
ncbi:beta-ketoacyl synthase N-terminal-like domain-containing protein [Nocardia takedensis]